MTSVRRCDNPLCRKGAAGTVQVSETANPDGWTVVDAQILGAPAADHVRGDFCTIECAAEALLTGRGYKIEPIEKGAQ